MLNLIARRLSRVSVAAPLIALVLGGCSGQPFASFDDVPPDQSSGGTNPSAGSAPVAVGSQPSSGGSSGAGVAGSVGEGGEPSGPDAQAGAAGEPAGGAGGAPAPRPVRVLELIDDLEGAFPHLPEVAGRNGAWFAVHDDSNGQLLPAQAMALQPARDDSHFAAKLSGAGFTDWGAQLGVSLRAPAAAYDASGTCGVRFLAKGSGSGWSLLISDRASVPQGGMCDANAWGSPSACYRFVGKHFDVGADWQEVEIRFDDLKLVADPESARTLDKTALYDIIFNFYSGGEGKPFELLVDDLSFIKETDARCP